MSHTDHTIVVTGATGHQGGAAARRLLRDGWRVRVLVRDPTAPAVRALADAGAEPVTGDFDDPTTLDAVFAGTYGVFLVPPAAFRSGAWDVDTEFARGRSVVDTARRNDVRHIVFTGIATLGSVTDSARPYGWEGKHRIEAHLAASGVRYTFLRPVRFMENYLLHGMPLDGIADGLHRHLFPADAPMQVIAVDDIGAFAGLAFADPIGFGGRSLELAGDAPTPERAAEAINAATGLKIRYRRVGRTEAEQRGPEIVNVRDLHDDGYRWRADIEALRVIHPGMLSLERWLETGGAQRILELPGVRNT